MVCWISLWSNHSDCMNINLMDWFSLLDIRFKLLGIFWIQLLRWLFIVPITFVTFFQYIYNFGPKHCKRSLFDILRNSVPGIEFDGCIGESENFASLQWRRFNHNLVARRIARNNHLLAKRMSQSVSSNIYDCPLAYIDPMAPIISGYET